MRKHTSPPHKHTQVNTHSLVSVVVRSIDTKSENSAAMVGPLATMSVRTQRTLDRTLAAEAHFNRA
jgi:hypothetical protein